MYIYIYIHTYIHTRTGLLAVAAQLGAHLGVGQGLVHLAHGLAYCAMLHCTSCYITSLLLALYIYIYTYAYAYAYAYHIISYNIIHPVSITRFPIRIFSPGAGLLRNPFVRR